MIKNPLILYQPCSNTICNFAVKIGDGEIGDCWREFERWRSYGIWSLLKDKIMMFENIGVRVRFIEMVYFYE